MEVVAQESKITSLEIYFREIKFEISAILISLVFLIRSATDGILSIELKRFLLIK